MPAPAWLLPDDWGRVLGPDAPLLETFVRVTIVYFVLILVMRVVLKREAAGLSVRDLLVLVLVADAVQNGLAGPYASVANALLAGITLILWDYALSAVEYRWPRVRRFLEPSPLVLVRDGRLLRHNMAKELITEDDLLTQIRQQGYERIEQMRLVVMESDGRISVIPR
ncbi:MAG TPA: YetF domain-containing protein [Thermodesulfobacteriota bacterium]